MTKKVPAMTASAFNKLCKKHGLSRATAAVRLGVHRNTVIRWGMGHIPITRQAAALIHSILS